MPELPEVETVRRGLNKQTLGQNIQGGEVLLSRTLAYPGVEEFWTGVTGAAIAHWHRRGKYLLAKLERPEPDGWLGVHLRMTGQLLWLHREEPLHKHTRLRWFFTGDRELRFVDMRTFGQVWWVDPTQDPQQVMTGLQSLGPEPFAPDFSLDYLTTKLGKSRRYIKTVLLDQSLVAGVGNIYADEALFKSGIHPQERASALNQGQIEQLHQAIIDVLETAIAKGGTTFSHFRNLLGVNGNYSGVAWVYGREGKPCRICGTVIERIKLAGRSAHFCPQCQPDWELTDD